jgi:hypothetical protein
MRNEIAAPMAIIYDSFIILGKKHHASGMVESLRLRNAYLLLLSL